MSNCPNCSADVPPNSKYCLECGAALGTQPGEPLQQPTSTAPPQTVYVRPLKDRSLALILEILPGLFGFLGIGWIYSDNSSTGLTLLIGYLCAAVVFVIADVASGGLCCFVTVPLQIVAIVLSTNRLAEYIKTRADIFGPPR